MRLTIIIVVASLMAVITLFGFNTAFVRFFFASGSDVSMCLIESDLYIRVFFWVVFFLLSILFKKWGNKNFYYPILITVFILWSLSGRMVALFPLDGRLISGWFYIETNRIEICKNDCDCEKVFYYETNYKKEFIWTYRIKNKDIETTLFTSPFIDNKVKKLFSQQFVNSSW